MPRPSIRGHFARELVAAMTAEARRQLLTDLGLAGVDLADSGVRLPQAQYRALYSAAIRAQDDELFGLMARPVPPGTFAGALRVLVRCSTLWDAVHASMELYRIFEGRPVWSLETTGDDATLRLLTHTEAQATSFVYAHVLLSSPMRVMSWLAGQPLRAHRAWLDERLEDSVLETEYLLGCRPQLADRSAWRMPRAHFALPVLRTAAEVEPWLRESLAEIIGPPARPTVVDRVRLVLGAVEPIAHLDAVQTAAHLRCSRATLARRLQEAGTTFRQVRDELRRDVAVARLREADGTVEAVAASLGFVDARSFRRAFLAWTGAPPSAYRPDGGRPGARGPRGPG